jgi:hypothetical protein
MLFALSLKRKKNFFHVTQHEIMAMATNLEMYNFIWFDIPIKENVNIQKLFPHLKIFEDLNQCEKYIRSLSVYDRVVLIANNQELITRIHELPQLYLIYIYSKNKKRNEQWIKQFSKVK